MPKYEPTDIDIKKYTVRAVAGLFALWFTLGSWYVVSPTDRANTRRFGVIQYTQPVGPGLHFKLPFIDSVDKIQTSLQTLHIPSFRVTTVDNQAVTMDINFNYTIPDNRVNHIMYEIGRPGNDDIDNQIIPVAKDRTSRIFSTQNMVTVNANRGEIQNEIEASIFKSVEELFGIQPHSLQIAGITPSEAFMASNEAAVKAKNDAVAAENTKRTIQFQADQQVIKAKGEADSAIEAARGEAQSVKLNAEAQKTRLEMEGLGQQSRLGDEIKPFGSPDKYIEYLKAKAALNWKGDVPQVQAGAGGSTNLVIPYQGK
jgi:regulator of protease activity HflC (stomatin/prohibitin superfamily)